VVIFTISVKMSTAFGGFWLLECKPSTSTAVMLHGVSIRTKYPYVKNDMIWNIFSTDTSLRERAPRRLMMSARNALRSSHSEWR